MVPVWWTVSFWRGNIWNFLPMITGKFRIIVTLRKWIILEKILKLLRDKLESVWNKRWKDMLNWWIRELV